MKILSYDLLVVAGVVGFLAVAQFFYLQGEVPAPEGRRWSAEVQEVAAEGLVGIERCEQDDAVKTSGKVADSDFPYEIVIPVLIPALIFIAPGLFTFLSFCFWGQERVFSWYYRQKKIVQTFLVICALSMGWGGLVQGLRAASASNGEIEEFLERIAAFFGVESAQFNLGLIHQQKAKWLLQRANTTDANHELQESLSWLMKAAENGHPEAQYRIGWAYYMGNYGHMGHLDLGQDAREAAYWFGLAAEQGDTASQTLLGDFLFHGYGVPVDRAHAYMWTHLASRGGDATFTELRGTFQYKFVVEKWTPGASGQLDRFASMMTPAQIDEGQRLAREWLEDR